ncbi:YunC family protein [Moritella sp. 36]|nr:YunC family protein [Moritella sp. 28]QUM91457.1 YunC family protein [Moritella sp. 36]
MEAKMIRYELDKPLLIIKEKKGMLACAYINVETCNKTNEACAIVSGVSSYKDMMSAKIIAVSNEALNLGVNVGDTGISAINRFK